jgi:hypothetical protein
MFYSGVWFLASFFPFFCDNEAPFCLRFSSASLSFSSGASLSDRSQTETNIGEERISLRRSLTDSLAVSSMLLLQPQQVSLPISFAISHFAGEGLGLSNRAQAREITIIIMMWEIESEQRAAAAAARESELHERFSTREK